MIKYHMFGILKLVIVICLVFVFCYLKFFITGTRNHQLFASCYMKIVQRGLISKLVQATPFDNPLDVLRIGYTFIAGYFFFMRFHKLRRRALIT